MDNGQEDVRGGGLSTGGNVRQISITNPNGSPSPIPLSYVHWKAAADVSFNRTIIASLIRLVVMARFVILGMARIVVFGFIPNEDGLRKYIDPQCLSISLF